MLQQLVGFALKAYEEASRVALSKSHQFKACKRVYCQCQLWYLNCPTQFF